MAEAGLTVVAVVEEAEGVSTVEVVEVDAAVGASEEEAASTRDPPSELLTSAR